jgi:ectoine hydroxylase-related dioxygenase (phytanoyl-CoA dioxygenase family)
VIGEFHVEHDPSDKKEQAMMLEKMLSDSQWQQYEQDGMLNLGRVLSANDLAALQQRIDDIMLGKADVDYDRMLMQLDSLDGRNAGEQTKGFKGATLAYRKIQELEFDQLFLAYMQRPIFEAICERVYGVETEITAFRAMFMNKPAHQGTLLPWHQDRWTHLDRDPLITVWTALDPATVANGCVQVIPGSHHMGLINPSDPSGWLTDEQGQRCAPADQAVFLELEAGEAVLLHNWLLHRSDTNATAISRRAFSVCYMDGRTQASDGEHFSTVFARGSEQD